MRQLHAPQPNPPDGEETVVRHFDKVVWIALLAFASLGAPMAAQTLSFQVLATPASFGTNVEAVGVSADGSVVMGKYFLSGTDPNCNVFGGCTRTFRWTAQTGVQDLGLLDAHEAWPRAEDRRAPSSQS